MKPTDMNRGIPGRASVRATTAFDIVRQLCPRCRMGKIFRSSAWSGFASMHERCPICDLKFEREEGYFLGAMMVSYILGVALISGLAVLVWLITRWPLDKAVFAAVLLFLPASPTLSLFSRVIWIYFDQAIDPDER